MCDSWYCELFVCVDYVTACVTYVDLAVHSNVFFGVTVSTVFVHVDYITAWVMHVDLAVHSNVFFGMTVGTVCYLSMCTMAHPVSHNCVDLAVH